VHKNERLVTIARFQTAFEASVVRGALEARGIRAFVPGEGQGSFSINRGGLATTEVQVFESDQVQAIAELRRLDMKIVDRDA
jgi:hypothetical protein